MTFLKSLDFESFHQSRPVKDKAKDMGVRDKSHDIQAAEMVECLRALAAFPEDHC